MLGKTNATIFNYSTFESVPTEYQILEYIKSDGLSYIDTLLKSHSNMSCELQFMFEVVPTDGCIIGARHTSQQSGEGKSRLYFYHYYNGHKLGYGMYLGKGQAEAGKVYNIKTRLDVGHQYMYINGTMAFEGFDDYYINNEETFYIFALNDGNAPSTTDLQSITRDITFYSKARLYYCKIWDGENLVRAFIPVIDPDGNVGVFDIIEQRFYNNSGSGKFEAGPNSVFNLSSNPIV